MARAAAISKSDTPRALNMHLRGCACNLTLLVVNGDLHVMFGAPCRQEPYAKMREVGQPLQHNCCALTCAGPRTRKVAQNPASRLQTDP